jgi:hypothetical protein
MSMAAHKRKSELAEPVMLGAADGKAFSLPRCATVTCFSCLRLRDAVWPLCVNIHWLQLLSVDSHALTNHEYQAANEPALLLPTRPSSPPGSVVAAVLVVGLSKQSEH